MSADGCPPVTDFVGARRLWIGSARNLRDVGGYPVARGGSTRWRTLFRSDSLHDLSAADQAKLGAHGVRTIIDLRSVAEVGSAVNRLADSAVLRYLHIAFGNPTLTAASRAELYCLALDRRQREFQKVFSALARDGVLPAVLQCTAGRDRTGLVVALALALVGVSTENIVADYVLSGNTSSNVANEESLSAEPMRHAMRILETTYGGARKYLTAIGVSGPDQDALRRALVQRPQ